MKIRSTFAVLIAKLSMRLLKLFNYNGTTLPGKIALMIQPNLLRDLNKNVVTVCITGTNGKTSTTSMIAEILKKNNFNVFTNESGANMIAGITTTFIQYKNQKKAPQFAVIEVDEASLRHVTRQIPIDYLLITNLFRDQLDRYGEVHSTLNVILEGLKKTPHTKLILNGDDPLFNHLDIDNPRFYFGFNHSNNKHTISQNVDGAFCNNCQRPLHYHFVTYAHLGKYDCICGNQRPRLSFHIDQIVKTTPAYSEVIINSSPFKINLAGMYNIYNALSAYSVATLLHSSNDAIESALLHHNAKFGRQEIVSIDDKELVFFLVKNPAGFDQSMATVMLDENPSDLIFVINDHYADGIDVSWLFDIDLEHFTTLEKAEIFLAGTRAYDMAIRLQTVIEKPYQIQDNYPDLVKQLKTSHHNRIYCFVTYTAMVEFRHYLKDAGYVANYLK